MTKMDARHHVHIVVTARNLSTRLHGAAGSHDILWRTVRRCCGFDSDTGNQHRSIADTDFFHRISTSHTLFRAITAGIARWRNDGVQRASMTELPHLRYVGKFGAELRVLSAEETVSRRVIRIDVIDQSYRHTAERRLIDRLNIARAVCITHLQTKF